MTLRKRFLHSKRVQHHRVLEQIPELSSLSSFGTSSWLIFAAIATIL